jgi:hypothetical protein
MSPFPADGQGAVIAPKGEAAVPQAEEPCNNIPAERLTHERRVRRLRLVPAKLAGTFRGPGRPGEDTPDGVPGLLHRVSGLADVTIGIAAVVHPLKEPAVAGLPRIRQSPPSCPWSRSDQAPHPADSMVTAGQAASQPGRRKVLGKRQGVAARDDPLPLRVSAARFPPAPPAAGPAGPAARSPARGEAPSRRTSSAPRCHRG